MTRRPRLPRWTAGAVLAAAALLAAAPAGATSARAPGTAARAGVVAVADVPEEAYEELAGSAAGVGREHPGRPVGEPPAADAASPRPVRHARPPERPHQDPAGPHRDPAGPHRDSVSPHRESSAPHRASPSPAPGHSPGVNALGTEPNERAADLAAHMLPLGTGLALMGLGLGFMGMRLRQGR